ncbi:hypothetical protein PR002_g28945 [Phytophthora rubi]|uniref:Uncharacterized protein n=1 Tax=Phytophthora rubi TaxID=129364 RepID=A0A6A3H4K2_9STRA|nr:hypothetical protein PR002_g28945 [Phytophthora rubi]
MSILVARRPAAWRRSRRAGGGVRARAWHAAATQRQAVSVRVAEAGDGVRATIAKLPLPNSKRCPSAWPKLVMASALAHGKRCPPAWSKLVMASALAHGKVRGCW